MAQNKPTVDDVDPAAMAVNATPDEVRMHGDPDEAESAQLSDGVRVPVGDDDTDSETEETPDEALRSADADNGGSSAS